MGAASSEGIDRDLIAAAPIGGFLVRLFAQFVDTVVWGLAGTIIALVLVSLAPNTLGLASAFPEHRTCEQLKEIPPGFPVPAGFTPNSAVFCSKSFFGIHFRDVVTLVERHTDGGVARENTMSYAADQNRRPKGTFDLDPLIWVGFVAYVVAAQARHGATFAKSALRLLVVGPGGGPPGWRAAIIRNLVLLGPLLIFAVVAEVTVASDSFFANTALILGAAVLTAVLSVILGLQIAWTAVRGRPGIHDRLAGTRVVRVPPAAGLRPMARRTAR